LRWAERAQARAEAAAREHGPAASVEWAWTLVERADRRRAQREIASAVKDLNIALSILAGLAKAEQPRFGPDAAQVSSRLADLHATADADKESQAARQNAWSLYRALSVKEPVTFAVSLAETLLSVGRAAPDDLTTLSLFRAAGRMLRRCERDSYGADQLLPVVLYEIAVVLWRLRAWSAAIRMLVQSARLDEERLADEPESRARRAAKTLLDLAHASREAGKYRIANAAISKARELCDRFPALMNADLIREIDRYNLPEMSRLHRLWTAASKAAISLHQITLIEITSLARDLRSVRPRAR
jgi:hypothetical protein